MKSNQTLDQYFSQFFIFTEISEMLKKNLQSWREEWKKKVKIKTQNEKIVETDMDICY